MKIATYNVSSVNARLPVLLRWLAESRPDVACLQELKAPQEKFPHAALRGAGYHAIWHGQKAWNGVAILARTGEPVETGRGLAGDPDDVQSRYLEGAVGGVRVGCLYLPNGNPAPGPKFDSKLPGWNGSRRGRPNWWARRTRSSWPVTRTCSRKRSTCSTRRAGRPTPCTGRRRARRTAGCSPRGGRTHSDT